MKRFNSKFIHREGAYFNMNIQDPDLRRSLRYEIAARLKEHGYTIKKLGELANINYSVLSIFLSGGKRTIKIEELDAIAIAFNESPGWLYELYVEECFLRGRVKNSRVSPFLIRCVELGRYDCIYQIVPRLLETHKDIEILFAVAEELFRNGKQKESIYFFQTIIENEQSQWSKSFIMSQYRLFRATIGTNAEENWKAVIRFNSYWKRLSENHQLDALLHLANVCFALHKWKEVGDFADELRNLATLIHQDELGNRRRTRNDESLKTERHLAVYFGQGYLLKAVSLEKQELYEEARNLISSYLDQKWIDPLNILEQTEVHKCKNSATAILYRLKILMGDIHVLDDYITFLRCHPKEIFPGLVTIVRAANQHAFLIDHILQRFSAEIHSFHDSIDPFDINIQLEFRYEMANYHFQHECIDFGIKDTLRGLDLAIVMNDQQKFIQCVTLFEAHEYQATDQQNKEFKKIIEEVRNNPRLFSIERDEYLHSCDLGLIESKIIH